jgi:hypothetical protein
MSDRNGNQEKIENGLPIMPDVGRHYNSGSEISDAKENGTNLVIATKAGTRLRARLYGSKSRRSHRSIF